MKSALIVSALCIAGFLLWTVGRAPQAPKKPARPDDSSSQNDGTDRSRPSGLPPSAPDGPPQGVPGGGPDTPAAGGEVDSPLVDDFKRLVAEAIAKGICKTVGPDGVVEAFPPCEFEDLDQRFKELWSRIEKAVQERSLAESERQALVAEAVHFLLSDADRATKPWAGEILAGLATPEELGPLCQAMLSPGLRGTTRKECAQTLMVVYNNRTPDPSILKAFKTLMFQDFRQELVVAPGESWYNSPGNMFDWAVDIVARSGDPEAAEPLVRLREQLGLGPGPEAVNILVENMDESLADRLEYVMRRHEKAVAGSYIGVPVPTGAYSTDPQVAMILDGAGRPQWRQRAQEVWFECFENYERDHRARYPSHPDTDLQYEVKRIEAAANLLVLRDARVVQPLMDSLENRGPLSPSSADTVLRRGAGVEPKVQPLEGSQSYDEPEGQAIMARRWSEWWAAWWKEHGEEFLRDNPYRKKAGGKK